jgi:hypothetical protein
VLRAPAAGEVTDNPADLTPPVAETPSSIASDSQAALPSWCGDRGELGTKVTEGKKARADNRDHKQMAMMTREEIRTEFGWTDDMIRSLLQIPDSAKGGAPSFYWRPKGHPALHNLIEGCR